MDLLDQGLEHLTCEKKDEEVGLGEPVEVEALKRL